MNAQHLMLWLRELEESHGVVLQDCKVMVEGTGPLVAPKIYDEDHDGKLDTIYLVYK